MIKKHLLTACLLTLIATSGLLAQTVQLQTLNNVSPGPVSMNINMLNFTGGNGNVNSITLEIEYDPVLLSFTGYSPTFLGGGNIIISAFPEFSKIVISWYSLGGMNINGLFVTLNFNYAGAFRTEMNFVTEACEISRGANGDIMTNVSYVNGSINPPFVNHGKSLSISQSCNARQNASHVAEPIEVPVIASGLSADNVGKINIRIGYDHTKMTYTGFNANQFSGSWSATQTNGIVSFELDSPVSLTVNNGNLITVLFDYLIPESCQTPIVLKTKTYMRTPGGTLIPMNLNDGWVTIIESPPSETGGPVPSEIIIECPDLIAPPAQMPVITDFCGNVLTPSSSQIITIPEIIECQGTRQYIYTYVDCAGLDFDWIYTVNVVRSTPPSEFGGPASINGGVFECPTAFSAPQTLPVVKDVCGNILQPQEEPVVGGTFNGCHGTVTYSYYYTDCSGLQFEWIYTYTVQRSTPPAEVGVPVSNNGGTYACPASFSPPTTLPLVEDACGNILNPDGEPAILGTFNGCSGTVIYQYTYTDCAGLEFVWNYTHTVLAPVVEMPGNETSTIDCPDQALVPEAPQVLDNCGRELNLLSLEILSNNTFGCFGTIVWAAVYEDCAGEEYNWFYTYNINAPSVRMPEGQSSVISCPTQASEPEFPLVFDDCDRELSVTGIEITHDDTNGCYGTIVWTVTYQDCAEQEYFWTYTYTVGLPVWNVPANGAATVSCPAGAEAQPTPPVVTDNCGRNIPATFISSTPTPECTGTKVYTFRYEDCSGVTADWSFTYTINPPVWNLPANGAAIVACPAEAEAQPTPPVVTDNCGRDITATFISSTPTPDCSGTKVYTFRYEDCSGITADWSFTYTINPPVWNLPANGAAILACPAEGEVQPTPPVVTDNCGRNITATFISSTPTPDCSGTKVYTFRYEDCLGVTADWSFTYTINPPVWNLPANGAAIVACPAEAEAQPTLPVVTDNCGREIPAIFISSTPTPDCSGIKVYTFRYTDCEGTTGDWLYTYTIIPQALQLINPEVGCASLNQDGLEWNLAQANTFNPQLLETEIAALYSAGCGRNVQASSIQTIPGNNSDQSWSFEYVFEINDGCATSVLCSIIYSGGVDSDVLLISGLTISNTQCFGSETSLIAEDVVVLAGGDLTLIAVESVRLLPGFVVNAGGQLHAYISTTLCEPVIPENLLLSGLEVDDTQCFSATESITAQNVSVKNGGDLTLIAAYSIHLLPDFSVEAGGNFHAYISTNYCENPLPLPSAKETEELPKPVAQEIIVPELMVRAYPNPTTGILTLEFLGDLNQKSFVEIFTMRGEKISSNEFWGSNHQLIDLSQRQPGIYFIRIIQGERVETVKVVKR